MEHDPDGNAVGPGVRTEVRTFLIADVRGYTAYTREHGDEAGAELAATFAALVEEVVPGLQGSLLELRGDEALVVFASARQALRAAVELQDRFAQAALPRGVGIGLDAGEAVPVGEGYRGGALNLAARLCSKAAAGQVLASESVVHLAAKVDGLAAIDPRTLRLKGYAKPVRAFEVVSDELARTFTARRRLSRRTRRALSRRSVQAGIAITAAIAVGAVVLPRIHSSTPPSPLLAVGPGLAIVDAQSDRLVDAIPSAVVRATAGDVYAGGHYWVFDTQPTSFVEFDARSGRELTSIASPVDNVGWFDVAGNDLWVTSSDQPKLAEVDVSLGRTINTFTLSNDANWQGSLLGGLVAAGSVWVSHNWFAHGELLRIDPSTGRVQHAFPNLLNLGIPTFGDGSIWVRGGPQGTGLLRIDPATNAIAALAPVQNNTVLVAAGGGFGWTSDDGKGLVYKVDRSGNIVGTYSIGDSASGLSFNAGIVWVCNQDGGSVTGIDAVTGATRTLQFAHPLHGVAAGSGTILIDLGPGPLERDVIKGLKGRVALLLNSWGFDADPDPARAGSADGAQIEFAACAGLLRYAEQPGPAGWALEPEVAETMPSVSPDGLTYTFTIRDGYRFSPPSNQLVTAETFRYSIERALSPKVMGPAAQFVDDIAGEQAFLNGDATDISGLTASGKTLTITLTRPTPDFPERITMPLFCPVPLDTPMVPDGAVLPTGVVASDGPYYLAHDDPGELAILERNPNYRGPRHTSFDDIVVREGIDPGKEILRVEQGGWDGVIDETDELFLPSGPLAAQWGAGGSSTSTGGQRYYSSESSDIWVLWLNSGRALFSDRRVREAVAYAVDRPALAAAIGAVPNSQILPANEPGWEPGPFPVNGPDLAKARTLMHGVRGTAVLVASQYSQTQVEADQAIKAELARIGIDVRIKLVPNSVDAVNQLGASYDMKLGAIQNFPIMSAAQFLSSQYVGFPPVSWIPPSVVASFERLGPSPTEQAASDFIRGTLDTEVPFVGVADAVWGNFFAPKLGCRSFPPASFGVDLAALCPQA